jgi:arginase
VVARWNVIGAPSSAGAHTPGVEKAPAALRAAGLLDKLRRRGPVDDLGDVTGFRWRADPARSTAQNVTAVARVAGDVAEAVSASIASRGTPLVLGGDCTVTMGLVAGAMTDGGSPALVYIDGGPDLYTPTTRAWGNLDAMGLAHLLALPGTDTGLAGFAGVRPLLHPGLVVVYGTSLPEEDHEQRLINDLGLTLVDADWIHRDVGSAVEAAQNFAEGAASRFVVHFDVDVLRFVDTPLADVPEPRGLSLAEAAATLAALVASPKFAGLSITEINPDHFPDDEVLPRFTTAVAAALSGQA